MPEAVFALVVIGAPGAGKMSVLEALSDALVADDVGHVMIENEALTSTHPALNDEQWLAHVRAACALHRRHGYELLLVAATVESEAELEALLGAVGADDHAVVRLQAHPSTLRRRTIAREPPEWTGLPELVAASERLSPLVAALDGVALTLSTEGERPEAIAEHIRVAFASTLLPHRS
jgi:hypothetical protein